MTKQEILSYDWIKENDGILNIYPTKCMNTFVLDKVLHELQKDYKLVRVFNDWIRAFKK